MKPRVLTGSKQEIADTVLRIPGEVREAIVFVEELFGTVEKESGEDIFAEMEAFSVRAGCADYSREALYSMTEDELTRTMPARFDRGFAGVEIGSVGSSAPLYPARWEWGWRLMYVGFALQVAAGALQLI
jgi:hypothetical protein